MKRSGAVWLVVGVVAVAALLMFFVVMPQIRDGKSVEDIAKTAEQKVQGVTQAVNDAAKQVESVADGAEELKAKALASMNRIGREAGKASDELQAALDKASPTSEELAAGKAKLKAALTSAADMKLPEGADTAAAAALARVNEGAKAALAELDKLPQDPAAARAALAELKTRLLANLPKGDALQPADATQPAAVEDKAAATQAATETRTADGATEAAKPAETTDAATPAFDILRVEKDGSTVIAGRAQPGAKVEIVNGDKVIASTAADNSGDFAAVLDDPLASGDHSITLKATKDGKSSTSIEVATVSVPKDQTGELLAMVTKPGEASKLITLPEDQSVAVETDKGVTVDNATAATPDLPASSTDIAATPPVVTQDQVAAAEQPGTTDVEKQTPAAAVEAEKAPVAAPEVLVSAVELEGDRIFVAGNTRPGATVRVYADDRIVSESKADNTGRFVADGTIRLAVGNHTIRADVLSADGRKVEFRASVPFFRPEGDLAAVASADATRDAPAIEPLVNGAFDKARDEAKKSLGLLQGLYADGRTPSAEELAAARSSAEFALKSLADVRVPAGVDPALTELANNASQEAGKALERMKAIPADVAAFKSALGEVETIVNSAVRPAAKVAKADEPVKAEETAKAQSEQAPQSTEIEKAGEEVSSSDVQVTAKAERLPASNGAATDDAAAKSAASPADASATEGQTASADQPKIIEQAPLTQSEGSVIIRRGDTLWQISRRVYGMGVRYTTIYVANQGQIEDPDRIRPGQIFSMPGKYLDNAEQLHKDRLKQHVE